MWQELEGKAVAIMVGLLGLTLQAWATVAQEVPVAPRGKPKVIYVGSPNLGLSVASWILAEKRGFFREEGFDAKITVLRGELSVKAAAAGHMDYFTNVGSGLAAAVRGVKLKIISVARQKPLWDLIAQPEVRSFQELRGKPLAIMSREGSLAVVTRQILSKQQLDPDKDVIQIVMGADVERYAALKGRSISATLLSPPFNFIAQAEGFRKLAFSGDYVDFLQSGLVTSDDKLRRQMDEAYRFVRGGLRGLYFYRDHREAVISFIMDFYKVKERAMAAQMYDFDQQAMSPDGSISEALMTKFIRDMRETTGISRPVKNQEVFDFTLVKRAARELGAN